LADSSGTTAADTSGNGRTGTYSGGYTLAQPGALANDANKSASFNGTTGTVTIANTGLNTAAGADNTVEFWMNWNGDQTATHMPFGFTAYALQLASGSFGFTTATGDVYGVSSAGLANRWVHVVAVFHNGDAKTSKLYLDGVPQALTQRLGTTGNANVSTGANISGWGGGSDNRIGGRIDEVAAYPYALGADRALTHFQAGHNPTTTYKYNGDGLRVSKTVAGVLQRFAWDTNGGLPLALADGTNSYVYGPSGAPIEEIGSDGTTTYYLHQDQLGSIRVLTDATGTAVGTTSYDAFGALVAITGTSSPFGYAGEYRDGESGLIYLRARYYDPSTGQLFSRDPLVSETRSAYGYSENDSLNDADPTGLSIRIPGTKLCIKTSLHDPSCHSLVDKHPKGAQQVANVAGGALQMNPVFQFARGVGAVTGHPVSLADHGVQSCSGWYQVGEGAMAAVDLWAGAAAFSSQLADAPIVGKAGPLFGRGGAGLFNNNNLIRLGWGWVGSATTGHDVFRLAIGSASSLIHGHLDIFP
jgi:RHS repeat-associated protein